MNKTKVVPLAACAALALALAGFAGCSSTPASSNSSDSNAPSAASDSSEAVTSSASSESPISNKEDASIEATDAVGARGADESIINIDGVDVVKIDFEMVGSTPNFQCVFSNTTPNDIEIDLSKFKIVGADGNEVSFHLTKKTVSANTPYAQNAFTASADTMKVGDMISVSYDGQDLGTYEVGEF